MNLFDLAHLLSPVGGAVGGGMAAHQAIPSTPAGMLVAIPVGLALGIGCYRGLIRLAIGPHDRNPNMPGWRVAAILGISFLAPYIAGVCRWVGQIVFTCCGLIGSPGGFPLRAPTPPISASTWHMGSSGFRSR